MTAKLEKAMERVAGLPEEGQDFVASVILQELESDERWETLFHDPRSQGLLDRLAGEALAEFDAGVTKEGGFGGTAVP
jgi:hypothetical protein